MISRERVFTASDGIEYKWIMGLTSSELFKNDDSKEPVATFHSSSSKLGNGIGNWFKSKPTSKSQNQNTSYLEIHPEGRHIPGEILLTFIYIEQERTREDVDVAAESYASGSNFKRVNVPTDVDTMNLLETHLTVPERVARDSESFVQRIAVSDAREGDVVGGNGKEKKKGKAKKRITVPTDLDDLFIQDLRTSEAVALRLAGSGVI
ncbi:hypothetical protein D9758_003931 [Tetrapyrgos nigripes]|uniref:DUF6593 domain-containing protein n=1 Tax=Tetrapyrgos nigripes TaxID=182062 RepID=A0A8H5LR99_9AGAR|nr:hypothetical protein D9758_003931 [Tetrapyrgos nigripes]